MTIREKYRERIADRMRPQGVDVVGFDRGSIAVRLLSDSQVSESRIEAFRYVEAKCKESAVRCIDVTEVDPEIHDRERIVQLVARAFTSTEEVDTDFEDPKEAFTTGMVRDMDSVSVDELYDVYLAYQSTRSIRVTLEADQLEAVAKDLRAPGNEAILAVLDEVALRSLVMHLVRRPS